MSDKKKYKKIGDQLFVGFMFLGIAVGFLFGHIVIGVCAGMGIGFIAMALLQLKKEER